MKLNQRPGASFSELPGFRRCLLEAAGRVGGPSGTEGRSDPGEGSWTFTTIASRMASLLSCVRRCPRGLLATASGFGNLPLPSLGSVGAPQLRATASTIADHEFVSSGRGEDYFDSDMTDYELRKDKRFIDRRRVVITSGDGGAGAGRGAGERARHGDLLAARAAAQRGRGDPAGLAQRGPPLLRPRREPGRGHGRGARAGAARRGGDRRRRGRSSDYPKMPSSTSAFRASTASTARPWMPGSGCSKGRRTRSCG